MTVLAACASPPYDDDDRDDRLDRLRLCRTETVGPVGFRQLLARFGSATAALDALPALARRGGRHAPLAIPDRAEAEKEFEAAERAGGTIILWGDPDYPVPLAAVADAPPVLAVLGAPALLHQPAVGMVGARNASTNGRHMAHGLARALAETGLVVVSGLARGIDTAAHDGALETGRTIAVLAGGVDVPYPSSNRDLHRRVSTTGAVVSEMPPGTEPRAGHFPRRNRIIAGLSQGVVVVEAALRSGSLITARLAAEQGREVMAVPGSPLDPRARGANDLLRNGATLVESAADVLDALSAPVPAGMSVEETCPASGSHWDGGEIEAARAAVTAALGAAPVAVDTVIRDLDLPPAAVRGAVLELEIAGRLERLAGGRVCLIGGKGY